MNVYFDSSALAKRYVQESGSDRVEKILSSATSLGLSVITLTELTSALCRRLRESSLTARQYQSAKAALVADIEDSSLINITEDVLVRAVKVLEGWPLRSADALHIASCAEWSADLFVSADDRQCKAAGGYGLNVEKV